MAIDMYEKLGYVVYRRVLEYYSGDEDAFGELSFVIFMETFRCGQHEFDPFVF